MPVICNKRDLHVTALGTNLLPIPSTNKGMTCVKSASVLDAILEVMLLEQFSSQGHRQSSCRQALTTGV